MLGREAGGTINRGQLVICRLLFQECRDDGDMLVNLTRIRGDGGHRLREGIRVEQFLRQKPLTVFGDGNQTRAFTYIRDVAPVIARSVFVKEAYNEIFNIGADTPVSVNRLAEVVCKQLGVEVRIEHVKERSEVKHAYSDHAKVERVFGSTPKCTLEEGVAAMAAWVRTVGSRESGRFEDIEIRKNMPPSWLA